MNKETSKLIPELRFPEFTDEGEWEEFNLGEVLIKNSAKNRDLKYTLVQSVSNKHGFINQDEYFENRIVASKDTSNYYVIKKGAFAYNPSRIDVGSLAYKQDDSTSIISPLYVSFKAKKEKIEDVFLFNWFFSKQFKRQMIFEGGVRNTLNYENLAEIKIALASLEEQQKIASCLSSLDELIAAHSQKLEDLKDHKKGLMQTLFPQEGETVPKYRFPEFENDGEWEEKPLREVFSIFQGYAFSSNDSVPIGTRWLKIADVGIQQMKNDSPSFLPENYIEQFERFLVKKGDYVLALTRPILNMELKIAPVDDIFHNALLNQRVGKIVTTNNSSFVYYQLQTSYMVVNINKNIAGNEPPNLSFQQIENITIPLPPNHQEQQKIAETLSTLDALIVSQADKIEQLKLHKKGLMQGLFPKINN